MRSPSTVPLTVILLPNATRSPSIVPSTTTSFAVTYRSSSTTSSGPILTNWPLRVSTDPHTGETTSTTANSTRPIRIRNLRVFIVCLKGLLRTSRKYLLRLQTMQYRLRIFSKLYTDPCASPGAAVGRLLASATLPRQELGAELPARPLCTRRRSRGRACTLECRRQYPEGRAEAPS